MKARYTILIIIGILAIIASIFAVMKYYESTEASQNSTFNYKTTEQVTDETFLSKTVKEWQDVSIEELRNYHENYGKRGFFGDLGSLLIKNEMLLELERQNIVNANDDFDVYQGLVLTSLPPHVSFSAIVNGTDGNSYRLGGTTFANTVSTVGIKKLEFFDTSEKLPIDSILNQNQTIKILEENGNNALVVPRDMIINLDKTNIVEFENTLLIPVRIQGDGDWKNPNWYGPTILPLGKATMTFNNTGTFDWHARSLPLPGSVASDHKGGGEIHVISNEIDELSFSVKQKIAQAVISNSEIPWSGLGAGNDKGLTIDFNNAIFHMLPDAKEYYTARAYQLIPFDLPVIIEEPEVERSGIDKKIGVDSKPESATSSYMTKITPTLDDFKNTLSELQDIETIFSKFGPPHDDIGSGIHIYVYELNDSNKIWIGYADHIWYIKHVDSDGNVLEELFIENEE